MEYLPQMKSMVITLSQIPEEELDQLKNFLGVYLTLASPTMVKKYQEKIFHKLQKIGRSFSLEDKQLLKAFLVSIAQSLGKKLSEEEMEEIQNIEGVENIMTTLEKLYLGNYRKGKAEGIAEGKAEGIAEGKAEGIAEGKEELLWRQIRSKFPTVPENFQKKLLELSEATIDEMGVELLWANDWTELEKFFTKT